MKKEVLISSKNLGIGYKKGRGKNFLFKDISFELMAGELTCLLGHNGVGKSTLLRTICAMQPALEGQIFIKGKNLSDYSEDELSQTLGLVLTDKTTAGGLTVRELVSLGRYPYTGFWGRLKKEDKEIIDKAMNDVMISHKSHNYVSELSDGERQKTLIAKALAQQCPIILLDEPTAFLDVSSRIEIMNLMHLLSKQGKAVLLSTHDIESALILSDKIWLMSESEGLISATTEKMVLSGKMSLFFKEKNILFEKETGRFLPKFDNSKNVHLISSPDIFYWVKNFLNRNGYNVDNNKEPFLTIEVLSEKEITIKNIKKDIKKAYSFEQLIEMLKYMAQMG